MVRSLFRIAVVAVGLLWWAPTIALVLLDLSTFHVRARLALWVVGVLMRAGMVDAADRLLRRSRAAVARYGRRATGGDAPGPSAPRGRAIRHRSPSKLGIRLGRSFRPKLKAKR